MKSVWSPASCSARVRRLDPAEGAFDERRELALAERDARPVHDRRQAGGEAKRDLLLFRAEKAHGELPDWRSSS